MNPAATKCILLDLDGTLYDYETSNSLAKEKLCAFLGARLGRDFAAVEESFAESRREVHAQLAGTGASHSRLLYIQGCIERLASKTDLPLAREAHGVFWDEFFRHMRPREGLEAFLQFASGLRKQLAVVTDLTTEIQLKKLARLGTAPYIEAVVTSEESGREKPAPGSFLLALEKIGARAEEAVMVGDDYEKDVVGAKAVGILPIYFRHEHNADIRANGIPTVENFKDLTALLCKS